MSSHLKKSLSWVAMIGAAGASASLVWWTLQPTPSPTIQVPSRLPVASVSSEQSLLQSSSHSVSSSSVTTLALATPKAADQTTPSNSQLAIIEEDSSSSSSAGLSLDSSDAVIQQEMGQISENATKLLVNEHVLRKVVRAINALEEGQLVTQYRPTVAPRTPFSATKQGEEWALPETNFQRYTPYIDLLETIGPAKLAGMYSQYKPLLEDAFAELGTQKSDFDSTVKGALRTITNMPNVPQPTELVRPSVMYKYKNKQIESMLPVHKLLLRMGPENRKRLITLSNATLHALPQ